VRAATAARRNAKAAAPAMGTEAMSSHHSERVHGMPVATFRPVSAFSEFGFVGKGRLIAPDGAVPTPTGVSVAAGAGDGDGAGAGVRVVVRTMCGGVAVRCAVAAGLGD